jgi:hypothetical protein
MKKLSVKIIFVFPTPELPGSGSMGILSDFPNQGKTPQNKM